MNTNKLRMYWQGKSILITGASSGLGAAVVEALAPYGCHFGMLSRREEPMLEMAERLRETGSRFWIRSCDVQQREQVYAAVREFHQQAGTIDVAWANSGLSINASFERWNWERVEQVVNTNFMGVLYTVRACLEYMVPRGHGTIVAIGSAAAMRGLPTRSLYSITKIGLEYLMESLAAELPSIQFTMIHPGWVDTPISAKNPNRMWLMQPDEAAQLMIKAVAKGKSYYIYPWKIRLLFRTVRRLPLPLYLKIARSLIHRIRRSKDNAAD